ncbi:hypothetical protein MATR_00120 [Marivirga tractuosa]|jgi:hypothetical protein|uniref:DUF3575 domain-containing protein n=1 Tax=Marivirga tractuosa (strain ATCC 23168 / DSM 4126 / NBRC 15989 / NCIMB 1408 / VKM B-1430 / H-43) TaxID=643867 RepID=E4TLP3_MARTH|nr:hypothetical protein [Marivirga tractuosa]ADR22347.1 hypothetical protein Ftrac_2369 [Marivirga tractuosa DSM 4126]BDD13187.1 hypothetical protein MATR_00120 [Marivirga tractuosa]
MNKLFTLLLVLSCLSAVAQTSIKIKPKTKPATNTPTTEQATTTPKVRVNGQEQRIKGEKFSRNTFYVNLFGTSVPASFNYERIITKNGLINFGAKIGGFYFKFPEYNELTLANASFEFNMLVGRKSHLFTMGFGWAGYYGQWYSNRQEETRNYGIPTSTFSMHYRFQKPSHSVFFQVGFTSTTLLGFASDDLVEMAIGNAVIYGMDLIFGEKPSFTMPSIGIGYSF